MTCASGKQPAGDELPEDRGYEGRSRVRRTSKKWPFNERPLFIQPFLAKSEGSNRFTQLTHQEAPRHTQRAEGRAEQHYGGAAVRNLTTGWAKEDPPGKAIPKRAISRNRDDPS